MVAWLQSIDWTGMLVIVGVLFVYWQMRKWEKLPNSTFRIWGFFVDKNGFADKYSLGYFSVLVLSLWAMWYLTIHDNLTEWFLTIIVSGFVLGSAWKTGVAAWREKNQSNAPPGSVEETVSRRVVKTTGAELHDPDPTAVDKSIPAEDITSISVKK